METDHRINKTETSIADVYIVIIAAPVFRGQNRFDRYHGKKFVICTLYSKVIYVYN